MGRLCHRSVLAGVEYRERDWLSHTAHLMTVCRTKVKPARSRPLVAFLGLIHDPADEAADPDKADQRQRGR